MNKLTAPDTRADRPHRHAFLLRLWCMDETGRNLWHASLEMPDTGQRIGFASLEQLFAYLMDLSEGRSTGPERQNWE